MNKTTLVGYADSIIYVLTLLSILPYTIGDAGGIIPPELKQTIAIIGIIAGGLLTAIKGHVSKDATEAKAEKEEVEEEIKVAVEEGPRK